MSIIYLQTWPIASQADFQQLLVARQNLTQIHILWFGSKAKKLITQ